MVSTPSTCVEDLKKSIALKDNEAQDLIDQLLKFKTDFNSDVAEYLIEMQNEHKAEIDGDLKYEKFQENGKI
eukprot:CAMPEP_0116948224 /NCGR_PEP_ID=MMETSP0467-20121206/38193_1 /TAXON_ID=283647 /ORGANISM="Mesodinium pulex, Strain SPMC105" /LENGTH=71 /DNA_ID=CAMNT_0004632631 /DNA_START=20 /DNA_END=233 /DNA_ORIENTATION=+